MGICSSDEMTDVEFSALSVKLTSMHVEFLGAFRVIFHCDMVTFAKKLTAATARIKIVQHARAINASRIMDDDVYTDASIVRFETIRTGFHSSFLNMFSINRLADELHSMYVDTGYVFENLEIASLALREHFRVLSELIEKTQMAHALA